MVRLEQPAPTSAVREPAASPVSPSESLPPPKALTDQLQAPDAPQNEKPEGQEEKQVRYRSVSESRTILYTYPHRGTQFFAPSGLMDDIRRNPALPSWPTADF